MNRKSASWAKSIKQIFSPVRKKRTSARLNLESLGDRIVPANFPVIAGDVTSLRAAITGANNDDGTGTGGATQTIQIPAFATPYTLTGTAGDNKNLTGDLDIFNNNAAVPVKTYILQGLGATPAATVIDAAAVDRVFQILGSGVVVKFQNITIKGGLAIDDGTAAVPGSVAAKGGGVLNSGGGDVFFTNVAFTSNLAGGGKSALDGTSPAAATVAGKAGAPGGNGQAAYGGGIYSTGGTITITGANSSFLKNNVTAGNGGAGAAGAAFNVAGKAGGAGGAGGVGGDASGGAIFAEGGAVVISGGAVFTSNQAQAGSGGVGGAGGAATATNGVGGAGGAGGAGGKGYGGAIYAASGSVSVTGGQFIKNRVNDYGTGGDGGAGGAATGKGGRGGAGGLGGDAGSEGGGAIAIQAGDVIITGGALFQSNYVTAYSGGSGGAGGAGGTTAGIGGAGGNGGKGGGAFGGAIFAGSGSVTVDKASKLIKNYASSVGGGGDGGVGGVANIGGAGGAGAAGGDAGGGAIYVVNGNVSVLGGSTVSTNHASAYSGGHGGDGGSGPNGGVGGTGGAGGAGGTGKGGGIAVAAGNVTIDGASQVSDNTASGGEGSYGGDGGAAAASGGIGGNGGAGGRGGDGLGGGIWAGNGTVTITGAAILDGNNASGSSGSIGGVGGDGGSKGIAGNGGRGGDGGNGAGGAVYVASGAIVVSGGAQLTNNTATGDYGYSGADGGNAGKKGGNGGDSGNGGLGQGGGIAIAAGNVTVDGGAVIKSNNANGYDAGYGGNGGNGTNATSGIGGNGGRGGNGGAGQGGGIWALNGTVTVTGGATITSNTASGSSAGYGGNGGNGAGKAGAGGNGGDGGNGEGGGIWAKDGAVIVSGSAAVLSNDADGSDGDYGGNRGAGGGSAPNGNGGKGGSGLGGGIYAGAASVTVSGHARITSNDVDGNNGGSGGEGAGGPAGNGGAGGDGIGGGVYAATGNVTMTSAQVASNTAHGYTGGAGGTAGVGGGKGGNGGLAAGGGIAVLGGTLTLKTTSVFKNYAHAHSADGGAAGVGAGGDSGSALGGGIYVAATAKGATIVQASVFTNTVSASATAGTGGKGGSALGGGVYLAAPNVTIQDTTLALNEAINPGTGSPNGVAAGGAVYNASKSAQILNSTVVYNNAETTGGGIRNAGTLSLVSTIVGRNYIDGTITLADNHLNNTTGQDIDNTGGTISGNNNLVENGLAAGLTNGTNANIVGKSFLNPTFTQTGILGTPSNNTVFVDSPDIGAPQVATNGTSYFRLVTPAEFSAGTVLNPGGKLPAGATSALDLGANPSPLNPNVDQIDSPRTQGLSTDIGAIEGNGQVVATSGARVLSAVFSGTQPNTYDKVVVTFDQAMQINTFGPGDITLLDPNGKAITILAVTPESGSNTVFDVTFAPQGTAGVYSYTQGVDILNVPSAGGFQMNQNQNSVNGEVPPTSPDDLFRTNATLVVPPGQGGILAVGNVGGTVRILQASDGTQIANVQPLGTGYKGGVSVALADFNGDGTADLAVSAVDPVGVNGLTSDKAGKIFIYDGVDLAKGTLTLTNTLTPFATSSSGGAYTNGLNVAAGDINGDGKIDVVAGSRGQIGSPNGPIGKVEQGRLAVVNVADGALIGSIITPFGAGYQKGVVVAAGNLDGVGGDEIGVTRGGPVAKSLPANIQTIKLKAFEFSGSGLVELDLAGNGGSSAFAPFAPLPIIRDARVAFVDTNGDGKAQLVFSALDRTTSNTQVRIATFDVNTTTGLATPVSTGTGPSNSYVVGNNIADHSISAVAPNGGNLQNLVLVTQSTTSQVQYLDPLNGSTATTGFAIALVNGGVNVDGF